MSGVSCLRKQTCSPLLCAWVPQSSRVHGWTGVIRARARVFVWMGTVCPPWRPILHPIVIAGQSAAWGQWPGQDGEKWAPCGSQAFWPLQRH